jgi:pSer/pThr/pTyr-binding forkhead associated (FHA) protein
MFALEITFAGDPSDTEMVFIRRPMALIGAPDSAHVVLDDMRDLRYQLRLSREAERRFRLAPIAEAGTGAIPHILDGVYDGEASVDLGPVSIRFTALDVDLIIKEGEAPDRAGVRILRQACGGAGPRFPALVMPGTPPVVLSFTPDLPVLVGRARQCTLRIDVPSVSSKHARVGFESGEFWVEDLGSTNGTFVNKQQIAGRVNVPVGVPIRLGQDVELIGVSSQEQLSNAVAAPGEKASRAELTENKFPVLVSLSESARPARIVLSPGTSIVLGRDPSSDMWLGAPHVSRRHCVVAMTKGGLVKIEDNSFNGTAYDGGLLRKGDVIETSKTPYVLDFGGGISVAVCFSEGDEQAFIKAGGSPQSFFAPRVEGTTQTPNGVPRRPRRTTTWLKQPGVGVPEVSKAKVGQGAVSRLYDSLSGHGRFVLIAAAIGAAGILSLIVSLILPVVSS